MKWIKIDKSLTAHPTTGIYSDWKELLAEESQYQCVYCCIHESKFGGIRNYHIDHFRPKSKDEFKHLENDYNNLFYSCSICNVFKSDDWPEEPKADYSNNSYPCPSETDYNALIENNEGILSGKYIASKYLIERLFLNRPQLILMRKEEDLLEVLLGINNYITNKMALIKQLPNSDKKNELLQKLVTYLNELLSLDVTLRQQRPYTINDLRRA